MLKEDFDKWINNNLYSVREELKKKYPKCKKSIDIDLSDFYEFVVSKKLVELEDPRGYLFTFIYNRHYRFFRSSLADRTDHLLYTKNCKIQITDEFIEYSEEEEDSYKEDERIERIKEILITLPLYDRNLYLLYYVQGKTIREIANSLDLSPAGIHKQLRKIKEKIKKKL